MPPPREGKITEVKPVKKKRKRGNGETDKNCVSVAKLVDQLATTAHLRNQGKDALKILRRSCAVYLAESEMYLFARFDQKTARKGVSRQRTTKGDDDVRT